MSANLTKVVLKVVKPLEERIAALEARIAVLEKKAPAKSDKPVKPK